MNQKLKQLLDDLDEQQPVVTHKATKTRGIKELAAEYLGKNINSEISIADEKRIRAKANKIKRSASKAVRSKLI